MCFYAIDLVEQPNKFGDRVEIQFVHGATPLLLDRPFGGPQMPSYLFVQEPFGGHGTNFAFPRREQIEALLQLVDMPALSNDLFMMEQRCRQRIEKHIRFIALLNEVKSASLDGSDGSGNIGISRDEDDRHVVTAADNLIQEM